MHINWHANVQSIDLKVPLFGRGGISKDLKSISITVRYSTSQVFVHIPCPSSNLVYRSLESTLVWMYFHTWMIYRSWIGYFTPELCMNSEFNCITEIMCVNTRIIWTQIILLHWIRVDHIIDLCMASITWMSIKCFIIIIMIVIVIVSITGLCMVCYITHKMKQLCHHHYFSEFDMWIRQVLHIL